MACLCRVFGSPKAWKGPSDGPKAWIRFGLEPVYGEPFGSEPTFGEPLENLSLDGPFGWPEVFVRADGTLRSLFGPTELFLCVCVNELVVQGERPALATALPVH